MRPWFYTFCYLLTLPVVISNAASECPFADLSGVIPSNIYDNMYLEEHHGPHRSVGTVDLYGYNNDVTPSVLENYEGFVNVAREMTTSFVPFPHLKVIVEEAAPWAYARTMEDEALFSFSFDFQGNPIPNPIVRVPHRIWIGSTPREPTHAEPIFLHEYGHQIFFNQLFHDGLQRLSGKSLQQLLARVTAGSSHPQMAEAQQIRQITKTLRAQTIPYQEVFCDALAVMATGRPDCISSAIQVGPGESERIPHEYRNFSVHQDPSTWTHTEEHVLLTPARSFLWERYLNRPEARTHRAQILRGIYDASLDSLVELNNRRALHRQNHQAYTPSPSEENQIFINALRQRLDPLMPQ